MFIKLNGIKFDLQTLPAVTKQVNNIAELTDRQSDRSSTFVVPRTQENTERLELAQLVGSKTRVPYGYFLAELPDGGIDLGLAKLARTTADGFELNVFGGLINFFAEIENLTLNDLDLSDYDHDWTLANAEAALAQTSGYCYPLIDYGTFPTTSGQDVFFDNFRPAVYFDTILNEIFSAQGWTYSGQLFELDEWQKLIMPFSGETWANGQRYADNFGINLFQSAGTLSVSGSQPGAGVPTQYPEVLPFSSFTASTTLQIEITGSVTISNWSLSVPGVGAALQFIVNGTIQPNVATIAGDGTYSVSLSTILNAGDILELAVVYGQPAGTTSAFTYSFDYSQGQVITDFLESRINYGGVIHLEAILPEMTQTNFIKMVCQMYGLTMQADPVRKVIRFETWDYISGNIGNAVDWSGKLDSNPALFYRELSYKFGNYAQVNNLLYTEDDNVNGDYSGTLEIDDTSLEADADLFELEASGSDDISAFINTLAITLAQVKRFENNEPAVGVQEYIETPPRVLTVETVTTPAFTIDTGNLDGATLAVSSGDYLKGVFNSGAYPLNLDSLKARHWSKLETSTLNRVKVITVDAHLLRADVANLDHFKPVYLKQFGEYFYINTINEFTGANVLTECVLIRL
jgi:hypothetical protein